MAHMLQLIATALFLIATGVTTVLALRTKVDSQRTRYLALTALLLLTTAFLVPEPVAPFYKAAIILALILYLIHWGLRLLPGSPTVVGYSLHLIGAFLYMAAFAATHNAKWPTLWVLLPLLGFGFFYWRARAHLAELQESIVIYMVAFFLMLWQAIEMVVVHPAPWAILGLLGAVGVVAGQTMLGTHHFIQPIRRYAQWSNGITVLGHGLVILSMWGATLSQWRLW